MANLPQTLIGELGRTAEMFSVWFKIKNFIEKICFPGKAGFSSVVFKLSHSFCKIKCIFTKLRTSILILIRPNKLTMTRKLLSRKSNDYCKIENFVVKLFITMTSTAVKLEFTEKSCLLINSLLCS